MNDIKQLDNIALVKVPKGATFHSVDDGIMYIWRDGHEYEYETIPGTWRFVALSTEMTEEKAREVVELTEARIIYDDFGGTDYLYVYKDYTGAGECYNPIQSFRSLLTALGCDPAGTYAVLININP